MRIAALFPLVFSVAALVAHADPNSPFPEPIAKSDVQVRLEPIATPGLSSPVLVLPYPGQPKRSVIVDQPGRLYLLEDGKMLSEPLLDVSKRLAKLMEGFDERGLLGLAFDPEFAQQGTPGHRRIFTYTSEPAEGKVTHANPHMGGAPVNHHSVVASWKIAENGTAVDEASRKELLRIEQPQFNHNGGMIAFGPDKLLYIGMGDGGAANDLGPGHNPQTGNSQDLNVVLGKMLRIDVNGTNGPGGAYGIPQDNPYVQGGGAPEIYALGLRNPWRFCFDGNDLLAADVGQNKIEYVHKVAKGGNYGWRLKEGGFRFNVNGTVDKDLSSLPQKFPEPIFQYDHDEGISITGGFVYRGKSIPALAGRYVFGDYRSGKRIDTGRLFVGDLNSGVVTELRTGGDDVVGFLVKGFGYDADGEIYVCGSKQPGPLGKGGIVMKIAPAQ